MPGPPRALWAPSQARALSAPVAPRLARGEPPLGEARDASWSRQPEWPDDLAEIVYIDHYGNAMTGLRAVALDDDARLLVAGPPLERARIFTDRPPGAGFWHENSNG